MPLAEDVVASCIGWCTLCEVIGGVAFTFPVGEVDTGEYKVLAGAGGVVRAVLAPRASCTAHHGPITAEAVLYRNDG